MEALRIPNLANACEMARENPDLKIVSALDISNLSVNDFVQLSHAGERFEVKVEQIDEDEYIGTVRSYLAFDQPFSFGDSIVFTSKNVFNVYGWASVETQMAINNYKKADKE